MKILQSHVSAIADLMKKEYGLDFHGAFTQVTGNYFFECEIDEAKRLIGERLGIRSGIKRRHKMLQQSTAIVPHQIRTKTEDPRFRQMLLIETHSYPD